MTLEELLKAKGLTDDQIKAILDGMKENKIFTASEENLDIRYGKLKTDYDNLTTQNGEATKLIEQLKKGTKNSDELQGKITAYETQVETLTKQLNEGKPDIEEGDYFENFAFVGRTVSKKPIIVVFDYALCTSGFELDPKHKSQASPAVTVECVGDVKQDDTLKVLPYHIYYPDPAASQSVEKNVSDKAVVD